jgi:hypothetical protein
MFPSFLCNVVHIYLWSSCLSRDLFKVLSIHLPSINPFLSSLKVVKCIVIPRLHILRVVKLEHSKVIIIIQYLCRYSIIDSICLLDMVPTYIHLVFIYSHHLAEALYICPVHPLLTTILREKNRRMIGFKYSFFPFLGLFFCLPCLWALSGFRLINVSQLSIYLYNKLGIVCRLSTYDTRPF